MTEAEEYLFDVQGWLRIPQVLSADELVAANAAVDHHADRITIRPNDLARDSPALTSTTGRGDLGGMLLTPNSGSGILILQKLSGIFFGFCVGRV